MIVLLLYQHSFPCFTKMNQVDAHESSKIPSTLTKCWVCPVPGSVAYKAASFPETTASFLHQPSELDLPKGTQRFPMEPKMGNYQCMFALAPSLSVVKKKEYKNHMTGLLLQHQYFDLLRLKAMSIPGMEVQKARRPNRCCASRLLSTRL